MNAGRPERPGRRWTPWKVFFLAFGLLVFLLVLLGTIAGVRLNIMRQAAEPTTPAQLEESYRLPPGVEDTTALWMEATALLDTPEFEWEAVDVPVVGRRGDPEIPRPGEPWEELQAAERLLDKYRRSLQMIHQAAEAGGAARYPLDLGQGMMLAHLQRLRAGARLLTLEASVRAHRGDPPGAAKSIRANLMLARSLKREPVLASMLVRIACESLALADLEKLLTTVDFPEEELIEFQEELRAADYSDNLYRALLGAKVMEGGAIQKPLRQVARAADQAVQRLNQTADASALEKIRRTMPEHLLPITNAAFEAVTRIQAANDVVDTAIAIERYRRKHGKLPGQLDELVPEFLPQVPVDPYDGQALRYVVADDGCRVYSIGMNRTDEGGEGDLAGDPDVVFRIELPGDPGENGMME